VLCSGQSFRAGGVTMRRIGKFVVAGLSLPLAKIKHART
jgi:hypothetical protein